MTSEYRHKLLRWLTSMGVLIGLTIAAYVASYTQSRFCVLAEDRTLCLLSLASSLEVFLLGCMFVAMPWHIGDLLEERRPARKLWRAILSYRAFFVLGSLTATLMVLTAFRQFEEFIPYPSYFGPHGSYGPHWLIRYPLNILSLTMIVICCCKLAHAAHSRFSKV
uniref:hypothetical protein n=1 Tax=Parerythrobacter lutipelagi TaxID=1964208 RepID=UPI0010F82FF6|nr:hypothetical protein [Parerythrobacter lutipelagi]